MDDSEVYEAPEWEESSWEPEPSDPEPAESSSESEPEEPSPEPEAPEEPREPEPETPPTEESGSGDEGDRVQDLIDAIGDLNQTITDAVTQEPEPLPSEGAGGGGGSGGDFGGDVMVTESSSVDLTPVVRVLERTNEYLKEYGELLEHQDEMLVTQHNDLLQVQANLDFVFLAVAALIGVVIGGLIGLVVNRMWRL